MPHSMLLSLKNKILKYPTYSPYLSLFEKKKHTKKTRILIVITYLCVVLQINLLFFFKKKTDILAKASSEDFTCKKNQSAILDGYGNLIVSYFTKN
jgi:hypothetical protein